MGTTMPSARPAGATAPTRTLRPSAWKCPWSATGFCKFLLPLFPSPESWRKHVGYQWSRCPYFSYHADTVHSSSLHVAVTSCLFVFQLLQFSLLAHCEPVNFLRLWSGFICWWSSRNYCPGRLKKWLQTVSERASCPWSFFWLTKTDGERSTDDKCFTKTDGKRLNKTFKSKK